MSDQPVKYKCPDCDKEFDSLTALGPHRNKAHGFRKADGKNHPRLAQVSKRNARDAAKRMSASRLGAGDFPCDECDFIAKWKGGLKKHKIARHSAVYPESRRHRATERSTTLESATPTVSKEIATTNGRIHVPARDDEAANHRLEAAATYASGRVDQLLEGVALKYEIPYRALTALVLRTVGETTKIR